VAKRRNTQNQAPPTQGNNPPTHDEDPLLTISEVARQIGKHPSTISRWVSDGLLQAIRMPSGLPAVRKSDLNAFLGSSAIGKQVV